MKRPVQTPDGVAWTVRVRRPVLRDEDGDLIVGRADETVGFGPLLVAAGTVLLVLLAPVLVNSGRGWVLLLLPVLLVAGWAMLARYPVEVWRGGAKKPQHRTLVAGRATARRIAGELAEEIARTPDAKLTA